MDAALYVGSNRANMQQAVAMGLTRMANDSGSLALESGGHVSDRFAFVSASLGSIICLDTLARVSNEGGRCFGDQCVVLSPNVITAMFRDDVPLYMLANQVPLLGAATHIDEQGHKPASAMQIQTQSLKNFAEALSANVSNQKRDPLFLNIVAFTDPADLLSYPVPEIENKENVRVNVTNVLVRNQAIGIWYVLSDPLAAHTRFPETNAVINFMIKGEAPSQR